VILNLAVVVILTPIFKSLDKRVASDQTVPADYYA
jgi:hypothetical protein